VELFHDANIDWLGKKWYFLGFSLIFSVAGVLSMLFWHHIPLSIDFKGGTQVTVPFAAPPDVDNVRAALSKGGVKDFETQRVNPMGGEGGNDVIISLPAASATDTNHDAGRVAIENALTTNYCNGSACYGKPSVQIVGPTAGKQLQRQALLATLWSLLGMLVYLWIRFEAIYGVAAVVAVFHDTLITVGAFSLLNKEISLTVIAAILTLIGYSMNDTIVVFDRIRENLGLSRRETLSDVVNRSINQTLSRTVLTSGLTFLTVLSLLLFGGPVLRGFSLALTVGVVIGTYSSIAVAAPMLVAYQDWRKQKGKGAALPAKRAKV
jgi:preprotein translocase subunit SecF